LSSYNIIYSSEQTCFKTTTSKKELKETQIMAKGFAGMVHKAVDNEKEKNGTTATVDQKGKKTAPTTTTATTNGTNMASDPQKPPPPPTASARKDAANANWDKVTAATKLAGIVTKNQRANAGQKLFTRTVISATTWDVFSPPPSNSVSGKIVPRVLNRYKNRRKVSIEVHRITPHIEEQSVDGSSTTNVKHRSYEECVLRWVMNNIFVSL
jgi:hypothetical protein